VPANVIIAEPWGDGGRKLTVFYERNISFYEQRYATKSEDYPIGYAEIFLDRQSKGQGTLIGGGPRQTERKHHLGGRGLWHFPIETHGLAGKRPGSTPLKDAPRCGRTFY
jgi:hypothetical protein